MMMMDDLGTWGHSAEFPWSFALALLFWPCNQARERKEQGRQIS